MEIVRGGAQSVVGIRPVGVQRYGGLKLLGGLARIALVFERERQIVVRLRVGRLKHQSLAVILNGLAPIPLAAEIAVHTTRQT